jgi:HD-GYP domain-containing protein (c-di-GMP phosphodiesterase class II)
MQTTGMVIEKMIAYHYGCPELVNHALKVFSFAKAIDEKEKIPAGQQKILEWAAVLHNIGIRGSEEK